MATLALFALGTAMGGTTPLVGGLTSAMLYGAIGGAMGSILDSQFLMPALFGKHSNQSGPRLDDRNVMTASEGSPVHYCLGPANRLSGTIIWQAPFKEVETEEEVGGKGGGDSTTVTSYQYYASFAVGLCERQIKSVKKVWANTRCIYNADKEQPLDKKRVKAIHFRLGSNNQRVDPVIESYENPKDSDGNVTEENTPAYRGLAYIILEELYLNEFGNQIPQITCLVEADETLTVGGAIALLMSRGGIAAAHYDVSQLTEAVWGYTISGPQAISTILAPLLTAYNVGVQEKNGKLTFFPKGSPKPIRVAEGDLGASEGDPQPSFLVTDHAAADLPSEVSVSFIDAQNGFQRGTVYQRMILAPSQTSSTLDLPLVLKSGDAIKIAKRLLWQPWIEQQSVELSLPPSYLQVCEGDLLSVVHRGTAYSVRVEQIDRGANFLIKVGGIIENSLELLEEIPAEEDNLPAPVEPDYPSILLTTLVADLPPLRDEDANTPGVMVAVARSTGTDPWYGAAIYTSGDGTNYTRMLDVVNEAKIGKTLTALPLGPDGYWDRAATVDVQMSNGELTSRSAGEVLAGHNWILIGREIVAYQTATLIAPRTYRLSGLLRGLRNTESEIGGHGSGEIVAALPSLSGFVPQNASAVGLTRYFKGVSLGEALDGATAASLRFEGNSVKPFSPTFIRGRRDEAGNLSITWIRRSRGICRLFSEIAPPLMEPAEGYVVEIVGGRTVTVGAPSYTYTAEQQTADGITPGTPVRVRIAQTSVLLGKGRTVEATL